MSVRYLLVALSLVTASSALAQDTPASRLDTVQKSGKLRVCTPGDYKPFSLQRSDGGFEGLDVDLIQAAAKALGVEAEFVKSA
jgi:cyclohexadienyl dehydratase